jgi:hypothetical protein
LIWVKQQDDTSNSSYAQDRYVTCKYWLKLLEVTNSHKTAFF